MTLKELLTHFSCWTDAIVFESAHDKDKNTFIHRGQIARWKDKDDYMSRNVASWFMDSFSTLEITLC